MGGTDLNSRAPFFCMISCLPSPWCSGVSPLLLPSPGGASSLGRIGSKITPLPWTPFMLLYEPCSEGKPELFKFTMGFSARLGISPGARGRPRCFCCCWGMCAGCCIKPMLGGSVCAGKLCEALEAVWVSVYSGFKPERADEVLGAGWVWLGWCAGCAREVKAFGMLAAGGGFFSEL